MELTHNFKGETGCSTTGDKMIVKSYVDAAHLRNGRHIVGGWRWRK
jgi:hypothetical protein